MSDRVGLYWLAKIGRLVNRIRINFDLSDNPSSDEDIADIERGAKLPFSDYVRNGVAVLSLNAGVNPNPDIDGHIVDVGIRIDGNQRLAWGQSLFMPLDADQARRFGESLIAAANAIELREKENKNG